MRSYVTRERARYIEAASPAIIRHREESPVAIISHPFVRFTELGHQMVNFGVRGVLFGRIVLQLLQIDIPSRLELAAAGATGG